MITRSVPIKKKRLKPRRGRLRDPKYLAFVATLPCVVCWAGSWECIRGKDSALYSIRSLLAHGYGHFPEVAHVGARGLGQKCSDRETVPLCASHHREQHSTAKFWDNHRLNLKAIMKELNRLYEQENV